MSSSHQNHDIEIPDPAWRGLYIVGGAAALFAAIVCRRYLAAELMLVRGFGLLDVPEAPPASAAGWFELLHADAIVGLALLDVTDLVNYGLVGLIFLALYGALRKVDKSSMIVATTFAFVGIAVYFASNQAFSMLSLSDRVAVATTGTQRAVFLSAGEALLAITQGAGIYLSLFLVLASGLLISIVMLRSTVFNKITAWAGILANVLALGYFAALIFAPAYVWLPPSVSAPFRLIWYILIGVRLLKLASVRNDGQGD